MEREALKLALEALEFVSNGCDIEFAEDKIVMEKITPVIAKCEEALAQPAQEPTGMLHIERLDKWLDASLKERKQREWVGLTPKQVQACIDNSYFHTAWSSDLDVPMLVENLSRALKEANA